MRVDAPATGRPPEAPPSVRLHLLDFHADWCIQCQMQRECLERVCARHPGEFSVERVNIDAHPEEARRLGVEEVPTLLVRRGNRTIARVTGAQPPEQLEALLAEVLSQSKTGGNCR